MQDERTIGRVSFGEIYDRLAKSKQLVGFTDIQSTTKDIKWYKDARKNPEQAKEEDDDLFNAMGDYEHLSDEELDKLISMLEAD